MFHDYECCVIAIRNLLFFHSYISFFFLNSSSYLTFLYSCFFFKSSMSMSNIRKNILLYSLIIPSSLYLLFFLYSLAASSIFIVLSCNIFHFHPSYSIISLFPFSRFSIISYFYKIIHVHLQINISCCRFYLAADSTGELWISSDESETNLRKVVSITGWTDHNEWLKWVKIYIS